MEIFVVRQGNMLVPASDEDAEKLGKLRHDGRTAYKAEIRVSRNYRFHKKFFALINCAWELLNERQTHFFRTVDAFRKTVTVAAGFYEPFFFMDSMEWQKSPKSIAFDKMEEKEFEELYERVKDVLYTTFLNGRISEEDFDKYLSQF